MDPHDDFARRAALRASWPGRLANPADADEAGDLSATTTAEQRVGMLWELTLGAWALTGKPLPDYARAQMPGQIVRRGAR